MAGSIIVKQYSPDRVIMRGPRDAWERVASASAAGSSYTDRSNRMRVAGIASVALATSPDDVLDVEVHPSMVRPVMAAGRPVTQRKGV